MDFENTCFSLDDIIFTLSMVTSFGALVYFGLKFNERQTNPWAKWFLAFPMFAASVASRAFTLAVFLKETTLGQHLNNGNPGFVKTWFTMNTFLLDRFRNRRPKNKVPKSEKFLIAFRFRSCSWNILNLNLVIIMSYTDQS